MGRCRGESDDPFTYLVVVRGCSRGGELRSPLACGGASAACRGSAGGHLGQSVRREVTLAEKTIVYIAGSGMWDSAFNTIIGGFKTVNSAMAKLGLKANGAPMTIYTATDDTGFQFQAAVPVAQASTVPANSGITVGKSPAGKALKFVHRGSYDAMDSTYELITNYLDEKQLEPKDVFVEQYMKDPVTTPEDDLVIEVYVPLK
jgi:effector-binding domain-containing protein